MTVDCPFCGKTCSDTFYLGKHVAQGPKCTDTDSSETPSSTSKSSISETIEENYGNDSSAEDPEPVGSSNSSNSSIEWETEEEDDNWRELDPSDPMEAELIDDGFTKVNMETEEVE